MRVPAGRHLACCLAAVFQFSLPLLLAGQTQVGRPQTSEDVQTLRQAQGAFNVNNLFAARQLAEKIRDAPGSVGEEARSLIKTIDDITSNNTKRQSAKIAIQRGKFEDACALLREIQAAVDANRALKERYADLNDLKTQAGGCLQAPPAEQPDPVKADYSKAVALRDADRLQEALALFNRIAKFHPGYQDVEQQIKDIQRQINDAAKKTQDERFAERLAQAQQSLNRGDLRAARRELNAADAIRKGDPNVSKLRQQMETAVQSQEDELADAMTSFYGGRYEQAQRAFEDFLRRPRSPSVAALARFYQGAALGSRYFLAGGRDEATRSAAIQLFQQSVKDDAAYSPRWDTVSPRIRDLYLEATRKQQ